MLYNSKTHTLKRNLTVDINQYVDLCLIDEYATKSFKNGYSLDIDDLPNHEKATFLDRLMDDDTAVRDFVLSHMQDLINERLREKERDDRADQGIQLIHTSHGDSYLQYPKDRYE